MRRLYQKIYLTIVASLVLVVLVSGGVWRFGSEFSPARQAFEIVGAVAAAVLPPANAPQPVQAQAITRIAEQLGTDLAIYNESRELIAAAGEPLRPDRPRLGLRTGRPGVEHPAARRPLAGSARAATPSAVSAPPRRISGCGGARGCGLRLSGGARTDASAGAIADRRRDAGRGRSQRARRGHRP
jgi:hypothetical protein